MSEKVIILDSAEELPTDYVVGHAVVEKEDDRLIRILKNMENALNDFKNESDKIKKTLAELTERIVMKEREHSTAIQKAADTVSKMNISVNEKEDELLTMKEEMVRLASVLKTLIEITDKKIEASDTNLARTNILLRNLSKSMEDYSGITKKDVADAIDEKLSKMDYGLSKKDVADVVEDNLTKINKIMKEIVEKSPKVKAGNEFKKMDIKIDNVMGFLVELEKYMKANSVLLESVAGDNADIMKNMDVMKNFFSGMNESDLIFALGVMKAKTKRVKMPPWASARLRFVKRTILDIRNSAIELAIIGAVVENEELGISDIAGMTGIDSKVLARRVNLLVKEGRLAREGKGKSAYYSIKK